MKRFVLLLAACGLVLSVQAQTPIKKSIALINKLTGTWCPPCGDWGWTLANELITETEGKALYVGIFVGGAANGNEKFENATGDALEPIFATLNYGGVPDFGANGIGKMVTVGGGVDDVQSKANIISTVNTFSATVPLASPANVMTISGNTVTVNAKVQFWSATSGEYYLAAYLIEDGAMNLQAGQSGTVAHHGVLRGSMSVNKPFGEQIANGSIAANQSYTKVFTFNVTENTWDKNKFKVYTVIWKKNGTKYEFVNASKNSVTPTGIAPIVDVQEIAVFPNPASDKATLSITSASSMNIQINITDVVGRSVYTSENNKVIKGTNNFSLPVAQLNAGVYNVTITSQDRRMSQRLVVTK